jgi:hypothetical protein
MQRSISSALKQPESEARHSSPPDTLILYKSVQFVISQIRDVVRSVDGKETVAVTCCAVVTEEITLNSTAVQSKLNGFDPYVGSPDRPAANYTT